MDLEQTAIERLRMASEMSLRLYNRQNACRRRRRKPMDNGKVHVEIGMDGKKTVSALSGSALELSAAAARILNIFYAAFCQRGIGEEFKETMRCCVNREDSPVWRKELAE